MGLEKMAAKSSKSWKPTGAAACSPMVKCSFPPIFRHDAEVLILGSMPGEESLRRHQYYAHPRNAFWPIMGALFGAGPNLPYHARVRRLQAARVAVWDVVGRCRRTGSLDADILPESVKPNNIPGLLRRAPRLRRVVFNGSGAETWFRRCFKERLAEPPLADIVFARLPSTSPAHAARSFEEKLALWRQALTPDVEAAAIPRRRIFSHTPETQTRQRSSRPS